MAGSIFKDNLNIVQMYVVQVTHIFACLSTKQESRKYSLVVVILHKLL